MVKITNRQAQVLACIKTYVKANGYCPSYRDIANAMLMSPHGAYCHVKAIEQKGYLTIHANRARSITLNSGKLD
jgi:repressor LexA